MAGRTYKCVHTHPHTRLNIYHQVFLVNLIDALANWGMLNMWFIESGMSLQFGAHSALSIIYRKFMIADYNDSANSLGLVEDKLVTRGYK